MMTVGDAGSEQRRIREALDAGVAEPQVMTWQYSRPAVLLGRSQRASPELHERASREHLALVSRGSGGGVVLAGPWMLSLTLLLPAAHELARASLPASYRRVGEACRQALDPLRIPTRLAHGTEAADPGRSLQPARPDWACFASVSHGELLAAGDRKIVGISQVRRRDSIAICVGVLIDRPDWEVLVRVWLGRDDAEVVRQLESRTASCSDMAASDRATTCLSLATALEAELAARRLAA